MKNILLSMMQYESSDRIPIYSLHSSLIDLTERIIHSTQLTVLQTIDEDKSLFYQNDLQLDYTNEDWFVDYEYGRYNAWKAVDKYLKVKNQSQKDLSYFSG